MIIKVRQKIFEGSEKCFSTEVLIFEIDNETYRFRSEDIKNLKHLIELVGVSKFKEITSKLKIQYDYKKNSYHYDLATSLGFIQYHDVSFIISYDEGPVWHYKVYLEGVVR